MIPGEWLDAARARLAEHLPPTPLTYDADLDLYLKWDNHQVTGSFKARGALNKILSLREWELAQGLVTASAGNHGQGVAWAAQKVGARVLVFASDHAVESKVSAMRRMGADVRLVKGGYAAAEAAAIRHARENGMTWISPYNDWGVIAGQATLALETCEQLDGVDPPLWVAPAGGGGLVSGVGLALARCGLTGKVVAVQSEASAYLHALYHCGSQDGVVEYESLADGLAGAVEAGALTVPLVRKLAADFVLVSEEEIEQAVVFAWQRYEEVIEGSAAVALAAALTGRLSQRPALVCLTGGNIQPEVHARLLKKWYHSARE